MLNNLRQTEGVIAIERFNKQELELGGSEKVITQFKQSIIFFNYQTWLKWINFNPE